jgi:large subunit ribosomal protein L14e
LNILPKPELGQIVKVLRGNDPDKYAVVIAIVDSRFILIADGNKRKFDHPKKKNIIHLQLQEVVSSEVSASLQETGRVTNAKLRHAIGTFIDNLQAEST